jgi:hypothetical protein
MPRKPSRIPVHRIILAVLAMKNVPVFQIISEIAIMGKKKGSKLPAESYLSYGEPAVEAPAEEYHCDAPVAVWLQTVEGRPGLIPMFL